MLRNPFEGLGADLHGPALSDTLSLPMQNAKANDKAKEEVWLKRLKK